MTQVIIKIKTILYSMGGIFLYIWLITKNLSFYNGQIEFFGIIQDDNTLLKKMAVAMLELLRGGHLYKEYRFIEENKDRERCPGGINSYSDDSIGGYADHVDRVHGTVPLGKQQRGQILPMLEKVISEEGGNKTIVEIGTANGDVLAYLAEKLPANKYIGVDFSVKIAQDKHKHIKNLKFIKGYALELLENNLLKGDIIFSSSTFVVFLPKELKAYLLLFKQKGFSQIVLNEPLWGGYQQQDNSVIVSKYLENYCWYHNYCGYLREAGYSIKDLSYFHYKHPVSRRPDLFISLIRAHA